MLLSSSLVLVAAEPRLKVVKKKFSLNQSEILQIEQKLNQGIMITQEERNLLIQEKRNKLKIAEGDAEKAAEVVDDALAELQAAQETFDMAQEGKNKAFLATAQKDIQEKAASLWRLGQKSDDALEKVRTLQASIIHLSRIE